jgi:hypothetical protein
LETFEVDLVEVKSVTNFEVIKNMDKKDPYPTLLGIEWAYDNNAIINLNKRKISFESYGMHIV